VTVASPLRTAVDVPALSLPHKAVYGVTAAAAGWIAFWGLVDPAHIENALSWPVPPLHARFFGALYLSGAAMLVGALWARRWSTIRLLVPVTGLWTGLLLVASLPHLAAFDLGMPQAQIWFGAYVLVPVTQAWLVLSRRGAAAATGPRLPRLATSYLIGNGALLIVAGLVLLLAPEWGAQAWPWPVTPMLAQIYGAPLLAYGIGLGWAGFRGRLAEVGLLLGGIWLFAVAVLAVSILHRDLFSADEPATWVWFAVFTGGPLSGVPIALWARHVRTRRFL
jgi:hypothetical protein